MVFRGEKLPGFKDIKRLASNPASKKVAAEATISLVTVIPPVFNVGPFVIGMMNLANAGMEFSGTIRGKEGKNLSWAAFYAACGIFECSLPFLGVSAFDNILSHAGKETGFLGTFVGGSTISAVVGLGTGMATNTMWYEAKRHNLLPATPLDVISGRIFRGRR